MDAPRTVNLRRDVAASVIPVGTRVTLLSGESVRITQALGGSYTVVVNGNLFRIDGSDADALGLDVAPAPAIRSGARRTPAELELAVWNALKDCYDPEIPINIVDLGLVYSCQIDPPGPAGTHRVTVRMTLTAPGCGMGPVLQQDVQNRLLALEEVESAQVELVWDPPWNQDMMTEAARLQLGFY